MTCGTCVHWRRRQPNKDGPVWGDCRRYPPTPMVGACTFPTTPAEELCGEFEGLGYGGHDDRPRYPLGRTTVLAGVAGEEETAGKK